MIRRLLIESAVEHLNEGVRRIGRCLEQLSAEELWHDHNGNLVSVGNLVLHLQGNVGQYILKGLGNRPFERHRDDEFRTKPGLSGDRLLAEISSTIESATDIIAGLSEEELAHPRIVQGFDHTGVSIVLHVVEHFSYHVGQITFAVKYLRDIDLGYYTGLNLNQE